MPWPFRIIANQAGVGLARNSAVALVLWNGAGGSEPLTRDKWGSLLLYVETIPFVQEMEWNHRRRDRLSTILHVEITGGVSCGTYLVFGFVPAFEQKNMREIWKERMHSRPLAELSSSRRKSPVGAGAGRPFRARKSAVIWARAVVVLTDLASGRDGIILMSAALRPVRAGEGVGVVKGPIKVVANTDTGTGVGIGGGGACKSCL